MSLKRKIIISIGILSASWVLVSCETEGDISSANKPSDHQSQTSKSTQAQEGELTLLEYDWKVDEYGMKYLEGVIVNNTNDTQTMVGITFAIYDVDDYKIEDAFAFADSLRPGEKWKFEAFVLDDNAVRAEPIELSGFAE